MTELIDNEIEQHLIGELFRENSLAQKFGFLHAEDFAHTLHADTFTAIRRLARVGEMATPKTVAANLGLGETEAEYVRSIAQLGMGLPDQPESYARHIRELSLKRQVSDIGKELAMRAGAFDGAAAELLAETIGKLQRLGSQVGTKLQSKRDVIGAVLDDFKLDLPCYPTGLPSLDEAMGGGLFAGKHYGFAARKKVGKTVLAGTISHNLNQAGVAHLFVTMEMGPKEIEHRNIAREIKSNSIAFIKRDAPWVGRKTAELMASIPDNTFYAEVPGASLDDLRRLIAGSVLRHKIKGVIIDYWQLIGGKAAKETEEYHLRTVAQWISDICRKERIFAITMAQVNQDGNTRGGEGLKLACDQYYTLHREKDDPGAWLEMEESRYTMYVNVGSEFANGLTLQKHGPYFEDVRP